MAKKTDNLSLDALESILNDKVNQLAENDITPELNEASNGTTSPISALDKIKMIEDYVNASCVNMKRTTKYLATSLVMGRPIFLLSEPGMAKSLAAKLVASCFGDRGDAWAYVPASPNTTAESVFGGLVAEEYLQGKTVRNLSAGIVNYPFVIVDEIFKIQNPDCLDNFIYYYDEESCIKSDGKVIKTAHEWSAVTSNELPEPGEHDALMNRINIKHILAEPTGADCKEALRRASDRASNVLTPPQVTLDDLYQARKEACQVTIPEEILDLLMYDREYEELVEAAIAASSNPPDKSVSKAIRDKLAAKGIRVSIRQLVAIAAENKSGKPSFLQAIAYLHGDNCVDESHLEWMLDCLWRNPDERPVIAQILKSIDSVSSEINKDLKEIRSVVEIYCPKVTPKFLIESSQTDLKTWIAKSRNEVLPMIQEIIKKYTGTEQEPKKLSPRAQKPITEMVEIAQELTNSREAIERHIKAIGKK